MLASDVVAQRIISEAVLRPTDNVLEIGTGTAVLTKLLAKRARYVKTYEIDRSLFEIAKSELASFENVDLVLGDAFTAEPAPEFDLCVTSLPYSQSLRFLKWAAFNSATIHKFLAVVQLEFADKLSAEVGSKSYRAASVIAQISFDIERLLLISSREFVPQPKVMSQLIRLNPKLLHGAPFFNRRRLEILTSLFSNRKKTLASALKKIVSKKEILLFDASLFRKRVESFSPSQFASIIELLESIYHEQ